MASEEIDEFIDEIRDTGAEREPARWLVDYLRDVKVIYAFQHLAFDDEAFMLIDAVRGGVHSVVGGIVQADGEGFSDESGKLILETP